MPLKQNVVIPVCSMNECCGVLGGELPVVPIRIRNGFTELPGSSAGSLMIKGENSKLKDLYEV